MCLSIRQNHTKSIISSSGITAKRVCAGTCIMTGLKIINESGRTEVETAHIKPVVHSSPDSVRDGITPRGTIHWMFDRWMIIKLSRPVQDYRLRLAAY